MGPKTHPAEWSAAAAALALLICAVLGVDDPAILTALGIVIGFIPTVVTSTVEWLDKRHSKSETLHET